MSESAKTIERDSKGIPLKSAYPEAVSVAVLYTGATGVLTTIGVIIAYALSYICKSAAADAKIAMIMEYDLGWLYLGLFLVRLLTLPINISLGNARNESKAGLPDQHVYKVMGAEGRKLGYVLMENEGVHGTFNRAQRALQNYNENFPGVVIQYIAASFVFPLEAFVCMIIWQISSCVASVGYAKNVDGRMKGRLPGYLAMNAISGMTAIIAFKALS